MFEASVAEEVKGGDGETEAFRVEAMYAFMDYTTDPAFMEQGGEEGAEEEG